MAGFGGSVKLEGESTYRQALKQITLDLKEVDSELKVVASQYDKNDKSQEALTAQSDALTKKLEAQAKKLDLLRGNYEALSKQAEANKQRHAELKQELADAVKELEAIEKESGKDSEAYKNQADIVAGLTTDYNNSTKAIDAQEQALSKSRTEINKAQTDYNNTERTLNGLGSEMTETAKDSETLGKDVKKSGEDASASAKGGYTVLKNVLADLASSALKLGAKAITEGVKNLGKSAVEAVKGFTEGADAISKGAEKAGVSTKSYQEWSYVLERSGSSIDGLKNAMVKLDSAIESNNKAFEELGLSSEALKNMSNEDVFNAVITGLQNVEDVSKRTTIASKLLGKGFGSDLGSLLNQSASETENLKNKAHELGGVLSDESLKSAVNFKDSLTDLKTSVNGIKNSVISDFMPSLQNVTEGLTGLFSGASSEENFTKISEGIADTANKLVNQVLPNALALIPSLLQNGLPVIIQGIETLAGSLAQALPVIIPTLFSGVETILTDLCNWLSQEGNVKELLNSVLDLVLMLTEQFSRLLPIILPAVFQVIAEIASFMTDPSNISKLVDSLLTVVGALVVALANSLPQFINIFKNLSTNTVALITSLGSKLKESFANIVSYVKTAWGNFVSNAKNKITTAKDDFLKAVSNIGSKIAEFVASVVSKVAEIPSKVVSIGANIAVGLWNGLKDKLNYLKGKIDEFGKSIVNKIKSVFKVASPSKLTKEIGGYLAEGLGLGFTEEMRDVNKDIASALPKFDDLKESTAGSITGAGASLDYYTLVNAFKEALTGVDVELDDIKVGSFVKKTVTNAIYT